MLLLGIKIFVIVSGPTKEEMSSSFQSYEDGSSECITFVTHSSCGKVEACDEFQIIDLPNHARGSETEIFEFSANMVKENRTVNGMYNSLNQHGYLSFNTDDN